MLDAVEFTGHGGRSEAEAGGDGGGWKEGCGWLWQTWGSSGRSGCHGRKGGNPRLAGWRERGGARRRERDDRGEVELLEELPDV